jgi:hypothetical protein
MKRNNIILAGIIFILFAGILFITDIFNPIVRPITHIFLMGSSKGKDILFFGLFGLFLILSQLFYLKNKDINPDKYLKIAIIVGSLLLISGIIIEVLFRLSLGIPLNVTFMSEIPQSASTSILHTHLLKSIFGEVVTSLIGPFIGSEINTGVGLYTYVPNIANIVVILFPILFIFEVLANQKRLAPTNILLSFFSACLLIGALDGGMFSTPAMAGICALFVVYRNHYYFDYYIGVVIFKNKDIQSQLQNQYPQYAQTKTKNVKFYLNRLLPYIVIFVFIGLRITISLLGANTEYYTLEVANPTDNIELNDFPVESIQHTENKTTYIINSDYNEINLIEDLKTSLSNKCDYYTLSWNIYSYI